MKLIMTFTLIIILVSSCENEVDHPVADASWPVVHCLLNIDDSVHYLRLGKTFSGNDFHGMIHNPDSLYYNDAKVFFDLYNDGYVASVQLEMTDELERDPGIFPPAPFRLYKTSFPIKYGDISLRIEIPDINWFVKGTIWVRSKPIFEYPNPKFKKILDFFEEVPVRIKWDGHKNVCETTVRLRYLETSENGRDTCQLDWTRYSFNFVLLGQEWMDYMLYWIKDDYRVISRRVLGIDILASGGDKHWKDYLTYKDWVIDLIDQPYSNLINAHGFFGSRASGGLYDYMPDQEFIDSLAFSPRMEKLKFVGWVEPGE